MKQINIKTKKIMSKEGEKGKRKGWEREKGGRIEERMRMNNKKRQT